MERLTERNSEGVATLKIPYQCDRCGEVIYRLADYWKSEPIEELARLEDLREQGKLLELPCVVGDEIWYIDKYEESAKIVRGVVDGYLWSRTCGFALDVVLDRQIMGHLTYIRKEIPFPDIGTIAFLAREEAEEVLKRMEGDR